MKLSTELRVELKLAASGFQVLVARPGCWKKPPAAVVDAFRLKTLRNLSLELPTAD